MTLHSGGEKILVKRRAKLMAQKKAFAILQKLKRWRWMGGGVGYND